MGKHETEVSDRIRNFLVSKGFKVFRMQGGRARVQGSWITLSKPGTPDLIACSPLGRFCCIEVKKEDGIASKAQLAAVDEINKLGGFALIAYSLGDVIQALEIV